MKKKILFLFIFLILLCLSGCGKKGESDVIKNLEKKLNNASSYKILGKLEITNNDETYLYDVDVSYKKDNNFRVSLINKSNNHEQIILKNNEGVYVVTPSLNKSFKFQSEWPNNNSQIYLIHSLLNDIKNDDSHTYEEKNGEYIFTTKVNYPNNSQLIKQKITFDKNNNIKMVEIMNSNNINQMIMKFDTLNYNCSFADDYFDLNSIIDEIDSDSVPGDDKKELNPDSNNGNAQKNEEINDTETKNETQTSTIDDIIYPLYIPTGTSLSDQEKVSTDSGERIIMTFDGEKPFLLVEENSNKFDEFNIIPTFGEPFFLNDTIGALSDNSISWSSNGMDYYIVSDVMSQIELVEIASSIAAIPTMK